MPRNHQNLSRANLLPIATAQGKHGGPAAGTRRENDSHGAGHWSKQVYPLSYRLAALKVSNNLQRPGLRNMLSITRRISHNTASIAEAPSLILNS